jgi:hypothetical protein
VPHWFARNEERPLFAFAGIWRPWTGERKGEAGEHLLYTFLPTEPNEVVRPVQPEARCIHPGTGVGQSCCSPPDFALSSARPLCRVEDSGNGAESDLVEVLRGRVLNDQV